MGIDFINSAPLNACYIKLKKQNKVFKEMAKNLNQSSISLWF